MQLIENKVSKNVGVLYKTSKLIHSNSLRSIFFSFIHSYINYANIAWASTNKTNLEKLFGKQKQAAHIIISTLSVFKFAQYYLSRRLEFARFKCAHPNWIYSRGLKFAHLICGKKKEKNELITHCNAHILSK